MKRIQRKRTKGFRLPPNTVCINRGTMWGNPFPVGELFDREAAIDMFEMCLKDPTAIDWGYIELVMSKVSKSRDIRGHFENMRKHLADLKGVDYLACFCEEGKPCHGDVIIEEAEKLWR